MFSVVFSLGVLRAVEDVFVERGSMEIGDMGTKSGLPSLLATDCQVLSGVTEEYYLVETCVDWREIDRHIHAGRRLLWQIQE